MRELKTCRVMLATGAILLAAGACKREQKAIEQATIEESGGPAAVVHVADPQTFLQLLKGFHSLEGDTWRWTAGKFSVLLGAPAGAAEKGATLRLKLNVPDPVVNKLGAVTLSAEAGGVALPPETFSQAGNYEYAREVPAGAFKGDRIVVDFALDKALPPGDVDKRELGLIVTTVGLEPK